MPGTDNPFDHYHEPSGWGDADFHELPEWKKSYPGASTAWSRREDWNAGYTNPGYQDPYETTGFQQPNYVAKEDWW